MMKKIIFYRLALVALIFAAAACASSAQTAIMETDWYLQEIRNGGAVINLDRTKMAADNMDGWFSLRVQNERISGKAAPNNYSAPCKWGKDFTLDLGLIVSTKMLAFKEPEALNENEFFRYMEKVRRWGISGDKLELYTEDGSTLVFAK